MITKTNTRRELLEAIRWQGTTRRMIVEIRDGILTARPKGLHLASEIPISVSGAYESALGRRSGFDTRPPKQRRKR